MARVVAEKLAEKFKSGTLSRGGYGYGDGRPMREPVLRDWKDEQGGLTAAITRNSYGCLVLNTAQIMFVDVDAPEPKSSGGRIFSPDFGKEKTGTPIENPLPQAELLAKAQQIVQRTPAHGDWRVYKTRAGIPVDGHHINSLTRRRASGKRYSRNWARIRFYWQLLQVAENVTRARLTPKPWRCSVVEQAAALALARRQNRAGFQTVGRRNISQRARNGRPA